MMMHDDICHELRELRRQGEISAWTHRDCARAKRDIYTIVFNEGNDPQVVEWRIGQVRAWFETREMFAAAVEAR